MPAEFSTIQSAVSSAGVGDTVLLAAGIYTGQFNSAIIDKNIVIRSEFGPGQTVIERNDDGRGFLISHVPSGPTIEGIAFTGAGGLIFSSAIYSIGSSPTIRNCVFYQNDAVRSGVLYFDGRGPTTPATPLVANCTFVNNSNATGGGIVAEYNQMSVTVENCSFVGNFSSSNRPVIDINLCYAIVSCTNIFGNTGGDWIDWLAANLTQNGNMSVDPQFLSLADNNVLPLPISPLLPDNNDCLALIGAQASVGELPVAAIRLDTSTPWRVLESQLTFHWTFIGPGEEQEGWQVEISEDPSFAAAPIWSSGEQSGPDTTCRYLGWPLESGRMYFYRIRVRGAGEWGAWSAGMFRRNPRPSAPTIGSPQRGEVVRGFEVALQTTAIDINTLLDLTFDFEVYADAGLTVLLDTAFRRAPDFVARIGSYHLDVTAGREYYWRVRVFDGLETSAWSEFGSFSVIDVSRLRVPDQYPTIRAAIEASFAGDTILVAPGIYRGDGNRDLVIQGKQLVLRSTQGAETTIIDCEGASRALRIEGGMDGDVTVEGFTFRNGYSPVHAGAVSCYNATPTIRECSFERNTAGGRGGALLVNGPGLGPDRTMLIERCTFVANFAGSHGGAIDAADGTMVIELANCLLAFNTTHVNRPVVSAEASAYLVRCSDMFGNSPADWEGPLAEFAGLSGNVELDPLFCDTGSGSFLLLADSPCLPSNTECEFGIGALGECILFPRVENFRVVGEENEHVVSERPLLAWSYVDTSVIQAAYEMQVGTDVDWQVAEVWTSGAVSSPDTVAFVGVDLSAGSRYYVRLRVSNGDRWSAWQALSLKRNSAPTTPTPRYPGNGSAVSAVNLELQAHKSSDIDGDSLEYWFEVYDKESLVVVIDSIGPVSADSNVVRSGPIVLELLNRSYWWRCRAFDGYAWSAWSQEISFELVPSRRLLVPGQFTSIREAVAAAWPGDTVMLQDGRFSGPDNREITIDKPGLVLTSVNGPMASIIDGSRLNGFTIASGAGDPVVLDGIGFFEFVSDLGGAAVRSIGSAPVIQKCLFYFCLGVDMPGGTMYFSDDGVAEPLSARVSNCTFFASRAYTGGTGSVAHVTGPNMSLNMDKCIVYYSGTLGIDGDAEVGTANGATAVLSCCNIANGINGNWVGALAAQLDLRDNHTQEPQFCRADTFDFALQAGSPCLAAHSPCGELIGALGLGCEPPGSCCLGTTGNVDGDSGNQVNLTDLTTLVNTLFVTFESPLCLAETNMNGDIHCEINLSDVTALVNYLFVTFEPVADCSEFPETVCGQ